MSCSLSVFASAEPICRRRFSIKIASSCRAISTCGQSARRHAGLLAALANRPTMFVKDVNGRFRAERLDIHGFTNLTNAWDEWRIGADNNEERPQRTIGNRPSILL